MTCAVLFSIGQLVGTPDALKALARLGMPPQTLIERHAAGDFGDLDPADKASNVAAVADGARVFSAYEVAPDLKVWVITEADRSVTTVLLPSEY